MQKVTVSLHPEKPHCPQCGAPVQPGYAFCAECGAPVEAPAQEEPAPESRADAPAPQPAVQNTPQPEAEAAAYVPPAQEKAAAPTLRAKAGSSAASLRKWLPTVAAVVLAVVALAECALLLGRGQNSAPVFSPSAVASSENFFLSRAECAAIQDFAPYRDGYSDFYLSDPVLLLRAGESTEITLTMKHRGTALYFSAPESLNVQLGSFLPLVGQSCTVTVSAKEPGVSTVRFTNSANREELKLLVITVN